MLIFFIAFSTCSLFLYAPFKSLPILADTGIASNLFLLHYANCTAVIFFLKSPGLAVHFRANLQYNDTLLSLPVIVINNISYYHNEDSNRDWT